MTWSDAARKASIEARRRRAKANKTTLRAANVGGVGRYGLQQGGKTTIMGTHDTLSPTPPAAKPAKKKYGWAAASPGQKSQAHKAGRTATTWMQKHTGKPYSR